MQLRWGPRRRSARLLGPGGGGPDLISALPDDLLLLVLARLPCAGAAARTGVLSRRWRGLWARLRQIAFSDLALPSIKAALGRVPGPPPAVSLLDIRVPKQRRRVPRGHRADAASVNSLLRAAARLEPEKFVFELPLELIRGSLVVDLPCFHRATSIVLDLFSDIRWLPAGVELPALEKLSLSFCTADIDRLLSCCPGLRTLHLRQITLDKFDLTVNSASLQELVLDGHSGWIDRVNIVAPELKQLTMYFTTKEVKVSISVSAPMVEMVSWDCQYFYTGMPVVIIGVWRLKQVTLKTAEKQGQLPLLHINACASSSYFHGEGDTLKEIEQHMIAEFSVLELRLRKNGHGFGALAFHLLGMNQIRCAMMRLNVALQRMIAKERCSPDCPCEPTGWRSQTISLPVLEEVEMNGFEGDDYEIDFLKLILKCAPMLKKMTVRLSNEASSSVDGCTKMYNIFRAYSSVQFRVYLSSGLMFSSQDFPSA